MSQAEWLLISSGLSAYLVLYNGLVWWMRPESGRLHVWIAMWSANSFVYQLSRYRQLTVQSHDALYASDRWCFGSAVVLVALLVLMLRDLTRDRRWPWVPRAFVLAGVTVLALHLGTQLFITDGVESYTDFSGRAVPFSTVGPLYAPVLIPFSFAALAYGMLVLVRTAELGVAEKRVWIAGGIAYQLLGGNDVLLFSGIARWLAPGLPGQSLFEFALLGFAVALTLRMASLVEVQQSRLEQLVGQRTSELSQALASAQAAAAAKSAFLASVSHEVRTPLNGIIGLTELLLDEKLPPHVREKLWLVHRSGASLRALVDDILDFSKLDAKRMTLTETDVDLALLTEEVAGLFRGVAEAKGISISTHLEGLPAIVRADDVRLRQVLTNLLSNAVKFTENGGVQVEVQARKVSEGEVAVRFEVDDTGPGISAEGVARLFTPFTQLSHAEGAPRSGTGLGLAICRDLVTLMHGTIAVDSTPGEGSSFHFEVVLPVARWTPTPADEEALRKITLDLPPARGRCLVADDNPVNRLVAVGMLRSLGYEADAVEDGARAVESASKEAYAVILMDLQMPVLDGLGATRALRERGVLTPIYALTAFASEEDRARCLLTGMTGYLTKPIRRKELSELMAQLAKAPVDAEGPGPERGA